MTDSKIGADNPFATDAVNASFDEDRTTQYEPVSWSLLMVKLTTHTDNILHQETRSRYREARDFTQL